MQPAEVLNRMIARFTNVEDIEHNGVLFKTNVPWRAPKAYLHILYPPAPSQLIEVRKAQLRIPDAIAKFYSIFNGASLFCDVLSIYGLRPDSYLLNREDWRCRLPFDLVRETSRWRKHFEPLNLFWFASYSYDRSPICIDRNSSRVKAFRGDNLEVVRSSWENFEVFLEAEVERLSAFFDKHGRTDFPDEALLPVAKTN